MMKFTPSKINLFVLFKIPSAYISGVRLKAIDETSATVTVKYRWMNQNPFKSMYWATQGMASELATGILVMKAIKEFNKPISMLVVAQNGKFLKKAKGVIKFTCGEGKIVDEHIKRLSEKENHVSFKLTSIGIDEQGDEVSRFEYEWSLKLKQ